MKQLIKRKNFQSPLRETLQREKCTPKYNLINQVVAPNAEWLLKNNNVLIQNIRAKAILKKTLNSKKNEK